MRRTKFPILAQRRGIRWPEWGYRGVGWTGLELARKYLLDGCAAAALLSLAIAAAPGRAGGAPPSPDVHLQGERVMRRFCLSCHGSPGGIPEDPLGPRLRPEVWGDPALAYDNVGDLQRINRRMDQRFTGSDADRRALAGWLAWRALENRTPPWKVALPWAVAGGALLAAGGLVLRSRGRGQP
jgi:mono/diheme cytochrome c family protein